LVFSFTDTLLFRF